ncbi:hypothetical protein KCV00_g216, partial [Aureobasidium melanogenum]
MNEETHAKAYDTVTNPVLEMIVPTQSILSFSCLLMHCKDFGLSSFGSLQPTPSTNRPPSTKPSRKPKGAAKPRHENPMFLG